MNEKIDTKALVDRKVGFDRRNLLKMTGTGMAALSVGIAASGQAVAQSQVKLRTRGTRPSPKAIRLTTRKSPSRTATASS